MDVTDVLRDRVHEPAGLERMITVSVVVHAAAVAILVLAPSGWLGRASRTPRTVMTISLGGGGEGPLNGGMTTMGGAPVQVQKPPDEPAKKEPVRPPAAKPPEMTIPKTSARPTRTSQPPPPVKQAPEDARGRTPTKGAQTSAGSTIANTGVRGQGFGLSTGGGPGSGSSLDVADFCCPDYIVLMVTKIHEVWNPHQGSLGECVVKFTIQRNGTLTDVALERSSGNSVLDNAAQRAIIVTRQLPPLPAAFTNQTLGVRLNFQYQ